MIDSGKRSGGACHDRARRRRRTAVGGSEPLISSAIRWGDLLFLSGRAPIDTSTMEIVSTEFAVQARSVLRPDHRRRWRRPGRARRRVPGPVLPLAGGGLRRVERDVGGVLPRPETGADDDRDGFHRPRHADGGRGRPRGSRHEGRRRRGWHPGPVLRVLPAQARRRRNDRRPRASGRALRPSSWGNGGWIAPAQAARCPSLGSRSTASARSCVDSALYFRPSYLPQLTPWLCALDVLQPARLRPRYGGVGGAREGVLRPCRRIRGRWGRLRPVEARHGLRHEQARGRPQGAAEPRGDADGTDTRSRTTSSRRTRSTR